MPADTKTGLGLGLGNAETIILETVGPAVIIGVAKSALEIQIPAQQESMSVRCADGSMVEIKPGRRKVFFGRGNGALHLLDCTCSTCRPPSPGSPLDQSPGFTRILDMTTTQTSLK